VEKTHILIQSALAGNVDVAQLPAEFTTALQSQ
jgi:hypothetical protein